ncbi:MAG: hypothetical protein HC806_10080 [Anaerolineae bacterium]|nr:hypothetical protein [Anaerolineae bacterium]
MGAVEVQLGEEIEEDCTDPYTFTTDINVNITVNSGNPGCITVLKRPVFAGLSQDDGEFQIVWTLAAQNTPYNLDVQFCYSDSELASSGVTDETSIEVFHLQNGVWQSMTTTTDPPSNCVSVLGITSLSPWTIVGDGTGTGNTPTAVELQHLSVSGMPINSLVMIITMIIGLSAVVFYLFYRLKSVDA